MNNQLRVWRMIAECIKNDQPVMLLYVVDSTGSSPGRQGFMMAVTPGGLMEGSIGGGMMEYKLVELAKQRLRDTTPITADLKRQVHRKTSAHQSGMICSGEQTVLLYQAGAKDLEAVENIIAALREYHGGTLMLTPDAIYFDAGPAPQHASFVQLSASEWEYTAAVGNTSFLHIIGGGHCSLALSRLIRTTGFHITVYDDRPGLLTMEQNDAAHERITLGDYTELKDRVPQGDNIYVVVMTFGYRSDDMALRALLHHRFRYLGLLGSRSKVEKMLVDYRREGIPEDLLSPIRTPAGLPINSRTPEEIAISIAAEIIQVKNVVI